MRSATSTLNFCRRCGDWAVFPKALPAPGWLLSGDYLYCPACVRAQGVKR